MMPSSLIPHTPLALLLCVAMCLGAACDDNNTTAIPSTPPSDEEEQRRVHEDAHGGEGERGETQGEYELIPVSPLQGQWRVVRDDTDQTPILRANIIMDKDSTDGDGDYVVQGELGLESAGETGNLLAVRGDTTFFFFTLNPTADLQQLYTVSATTRVDDDTYKGTLKDEASLNMNVTLIRAPAP